MTAKSEPKAKREGIHCISTTCAPDLAKSAIGMQDSKLFSYLDFPVCFPCYPPKSFKIICLTCIWLKFVDTSFHSSQKKSIKHHTHRQTFSQNWKDRCVKLKTPGGVTSCGPNMGAIGSNAIFWQI